MSCIKFDLKPLPFALALAFALHFPISYAQTSSRAAQPIDLQIAAQPLGQALNDFARQAQMELIVQPSVVAGKTAPAVSGKLSPEQALRQLLGGSGLLASIQGQTIIVRQAPLKPTSEFTSLPTVSVQADSEQSYVATESAAVSKTDTPIIEIPQSVSVITKKQLENQKPRSITEALNYTPGAFTGLVGSSNRYDYVALRGFADSSVDNTVLDGLRLLSDQGAYSSMQVDPYFLERIDVIRGPASVLYGRASPGGLVALTSRTPQFTPHREAQVTIGNYDRREAAIDLTGPIGDNGTMAYRLTALARSMDSQFHGVEEERYVVAPSLAFNFSKDTSLLLQAYLQRDPEGSYHSGIPANASITREQNGSKISRHFFDGDPGIDKYERDQNFIGYQFEHTFNDAIKFRQNFRYVDANSKLSQVYQTSWASSQELNREFSGADENTRGYSIDNQVEARFNTGAVEHTLLAGLDYQKRRVDGSWQWGPVTPTINVFEPVYGNAVVDIQMDMPIDRQLRQTGLYFQDQLALGNWRFTAGGRQDWAKISNQSGVAEPAEWDGSRFTKRLGAVYLFDSGLAPYVGYSEGFNPSLRNDRYGNNLKPTESSQREVGIRYQPKGSNTLLSAALYDLDQKNLATRDPAQLFAVIPAGRVESKGLELEARTDFTNTLSVLASYTYARMKFTESNDGLEGNTPYQAPRHLASVWGDWTFMPGYSLGAGVRYVGKSWGDNANTFRVPSYTLADLMLRVDLEQVNPAFKGLNLRLAANNVFDKTYIASCMNAQYCYWGDARNVTATLSYQW